MNTHVFFRALCATALITAWSATASAAAQIDPDELINLDLKQASLVETLRSFAKISGSRIDVDPEIEGAVTMTLEKTPWRQVMDRICTDHLLNCELLSGEPPVLRVRSTIEAQGAAGRAGYAEGINMSLKSADLRQTLQAFGVIAGIEVIVDDAVSGSLTIEIKDAPWTVVLEEACNLSGCRIEWGASELRILPAGPALTAHRRAPLRFDRVPVAEALATIAGMSIFGAIGQPELTLTGDLEVTIDLDLDGVDWLEALNAVCRAGDCRWQLTYGAPSRLTVRPRQKGLTGRVRLPAGPTTIEGAAGVLAALLDLETDLHSDLNPLAEVRFAAPEAIWEDAADDVCKQAGCLWTVDQGRLLLSPRVKALSERPPAGAGERRVKVRFSVPHASSPVEEVTRFNWAMPIRTFDAGGEKRWRLRLSWLPLRPDLDLLVPTIIRCAPSGSESELLEPARWPLEEPVTRQWRGAIVELSNPSFQESTTPRGHGGGTASSPVPDTDCAGESAGEIHATFHRAGTADVPAIHQTVLTLEARVGTYLLVTPPGTEQGSVTTMAVLALGAGREGPRLALITPAGDGSGALVTRRTLPAVGEIRERIAAPGGHEFDLHLRAAN